MNQNLEKHKGLEAKRPFSLIESWGPWEVVPFRIFSFRTLGAGGFFSGTDGFEFSRVPA